MTQRFPWTGWLLLVLSACAMLPVAAPVPSPAEETFAFNGRVFLSGKNGALSGNLRWEHDRASDRLVLSTPTGQGLARLTRTPNGAELTTPEGRHEAGASDELTARLFGAPLSLEALSHWVLGRDGGQQSWAVEVLESRVHGSRKLPARLVLRTTGAELRLVIDEWTSLP